MNFYFAPLEGLTGYIYRNAHNTFFNSNKNIDKYFSPFIVANQGKGFKTREIKDVLPENNEGLFLVPQILTNNAADFIHTSKRIKELGYEEVNLNLGCPSGTVVTKGKGAGFLAKRKELDEFLCEIYSEGATKISIKTRIGKDDPKEFYELIEIFNKYPIKELIIHPRIQKDFYNNKPNMKVFKDALESSKNPICYNGDIFTVEDYNKFTCDFPKVEIIMLGRGLLANPALVNEIKGDGKLDKKLLKEFHDKAYEDYKIEMSGERNVLFKMKEMWHYMIWMFPDSEKIAKKIKKSQTLKEYEQAITSLI